MNSISEPTDAFLITRREAIKRASLVLGAALSPSILAGVLRAQVSSTGAPRTTSYLSAPQFATVTAIADRILPKTDTPGALDVGVPAFIDLMYGEYLTPEEKRVLAAGLAGVDAASTTKSKRPFRELAPADQDALLKEIAAASQDKEKTFFHLIKELTVLGYFSSEPIGKHVLHYDPIPGRYDACIPLSDVGNVSWTR
jgi:gluconate 2-dehydrogenase gamma chain